MHGSLSANRCGRASSSGYLQRFTIFRIFISDSHLQRAMSDRAHWPAPLSSRPIAAHPAKFISRYSRPSVLQLAYDRFSYILLRTVATCELFIVQSECRIGQQIEWQAGCSTVAVDGVIIATVAVGLKLLIHFIR